MVTEGIPLRTQESRFRLVFGFCCGEPSVAFRSAKAAWTGRYFRRAKGDDPGSLLGPQQKLLGIGIATFAMRGVSPRPILREAVLQRGP